MNKKSLFLRINLLGTLILILQSPLYSQKDVLTNDIKLVIAQYANAREASNPEEIRLLFCDDADQLVSSGEWRHGKESLVKGMLQSSQNNPGQRTLTVETVRSITAEIAIADARYDIKRPDGTERNMWSTFILKKEADRWKIAAIRNMLPAR